MPARFAIRYAHRLFDISTDAAAEPPLVSVREERVDGLNLPSVELLVDSTGALSLRDGSGAVAGAIAGAVVGAMAGAMAGAVAGEAGLGALLSDARAWSELSGADAVRLDAIAALVQDELSAGRPGSDAMAGALAIQFLVLASRALSSAPTRWQAPAGVWSVADAVRFVDERYEDSFSLEFFVERCATNVSDFSRRFKRLAGCPLFEYLNRRRVARACALLKSSDMTIIEIAQAVGYRNLSFFNRYFLRIMGISPRAFRLSSR